MKLQLEFIETSTGDTYSGLKVTYGDKYADGLCYDEMIGLVTVITSPTGEMCLHWLKTSEEHKRLRALRGDKGMKTGDMVRHYLHGHVGMIILSVDYYWHIYWYGGREGAEHAERIRKHGMPACWQPKSVELI